MTFDIKLPDLPRWTQIGGDCDPGAHGGLLARVDCGQLELLEIQPVRSCVGDNEAADVGFPFWSSESSYDLDDLSSFDKAALDCVGLDSDQLSDFEGNDRFSAAEQRALAIAEALHSYGDGVDEGPAGWAADVCPDEVLWWSGKVEGPEYIAKEDDLFRTEVLGEDEPEESDGAA